MTRDRFALALVRLSYIVRFSVMAWGTFTEITYKVTPASEEDNGRWLQALIMADEMEHRLLTSAGPSFGIAVEKISTRVFILKPAGYSTLPPLDELKEAEI